MRPRRYLRQITLAACLFALALPASAAAATPDQILRDLAAHQIHSWTDNSIGFPAMVAKYQAGERLNITCYYVSEVARQLLHAAGYPARVVETITREPFNDFDDGHSMVEVFTGGQWQLYDIDANERAVDANGAGISLVDQAEAVREGRALWEPIASDPLYRTDEPDTTLRDQIAALFADPAAFYQRVMGILFLPRSATGTIFKGMYYVDPDGTSILQAHGITGRYLTTPAVWAILTTTDQVPALPVTAKSPVPHPQPVAVPVRSTPTPVASLVRTVKAKHHSRHRHRHHHHRHGMYGSAVTHLFGI
jgi:hypothetical protein